MPISSSHVNSSVVDAIEKMLDGANEATRAAVVGLAARGKVRAFSPHFAALPLSEQRRLQDLTREAMAGRGSVISATGISAALAMNWAEAQGRPYQLVKTADGAYSVELLG